MPNLHIKLYLRCIHSGKTLVCIGFRSVCGFRHPLGGTWHIYPPGKGGLLYFEFAVQGGGRRDLLASCQHGGGKRGSLNKAYSDQIWGLPLLLPSFGTVLPGPPTGICPGATSQSSSLQSVPTRQSSTKISLPEFPPLSSPTPSSVADATFGTRVTCTSLMSQKSYPPKQYTCASQGSCEDDALTRKSESSGGSQDP